MEHARPPAELCLEGGPASRAEAWRKWFQQFMVFLKASGIHKETSDVQASLLINLIGSEGYDVYTTFKFTKEEDKEHFETLISKFNEHFQTKHNTTMARFKFFTRNQVTGESIDEYVTALKLLTQHCEFEHLEEGLIRDRIVCGVVDGRLRDRLLRSEDLTLARAVKLCQANEMSHEEKRQIEESKAGTSCEGTAVVVDAVQGSRGSHGGRGRRAQRWRGSGTQRRRPGAAAAQPSACTTCASAACDGYQCPAAKVMCYLCHKRGHYKKVCPYSSKRVVYQLEENDISDGEMYYISAIDEYNNTGDTKWYETLILHANGEKEKFKLDTGSDLNVISMNTFKRLGFQVQNLNCDKTKAQSFCGNYIPIAGSYNIDWIYKGEIYKLRFVISKQDCYSLLGKYACEELGIVKRIFSLNIQRYEDLFRGLGKLPGKYNIVTCRDAQPSICPVRKIPLGVRDKLLVELNRMERLGVIRKVTHPTPWVNAIVVAAKKDGTIRVCLDPRPLNRAVQRAHYPLPTLTEIATKLQGARYFSKLDARSGFWMVQIDDESANLCTFGTPFGRYQFLRLPYGINCASEVFHSKIRQILEDLPGVDSFVDDVIVWASSKAEHDARLKLLLDRAREVGIKFNKEKCEFCVQEVTYLGHTFSAEGMSIDKNKLKAIQQMPSPGDKQSLERFLGMINYLSKFIPDYSEIASPLRSLLKKDSEWLWDEVHDSAVRRLKDLVCEAPVLALYSPREPVLLSVDASSRALGAVLLQSGRPVEFASATLTDTQSRYAQIEKELLAIVYALERFHQYVYGRNNITVETDHKPLEALFKKPLDSIPARLQRMMLRTQGYDFTVVYKPGKYMFVADALSRAALVDNVKESISEEITEQSCFLVQNVRFSDTKMSMIRHEIAKDNECQLIIKYIHNGWPANKHEVDESVRAQWSYSQHFEYMDGIIFKDNLVYIPRSLRPEMISRVHDGHMGIDRCKRNGREVMFWPGMSRDIENAVRRCAACSQRQPRPTREPLLPHHIPDRPWAKVGSDIFQYGNKYFMLLVDYFSNFIEVNPLKSIGSKAVIAAMKDQFARHGVPSELVTDNGPAYASKEFANFKNNWGFHHITTSPNYPQSNGRSERSVRTIKNILIKSIESGSDFYLGLLNFRNTPRDDIGSPAQLLMGRRLNSRLPSHFTKLMPSRDNTADYQNIVRKQEVSKQYYDKHARPLPSLKTGDTAIMADGNRRKNVRVQSQAVQPRSYFVTDNTGRRYRRNRRHLLKVKSNSQYDDVSPGQSNSLYKPDRDEEKWSSAESDDDTTTSPHGHVSRETNNLLGNHSNDENTHTVRTHRPAAVIARKKLGEIFKE